MTYVEVVRYLTGRRLERRIAQDIVGELAGFGRGVIKRYEDRTQIPSAENLIKWAGVLGVEFGCNVRRAAGNS